jgi:hypothetical protein
VENRSFALCCDQGIGGWMELVAAVEETSTRMAGGENSCVVATPVVWHHFIRLE